MTIIHPSLNKTASGQQQIPTKDEQINLGIRMFKPSIDESTDGGETVHQTEMSFQSQKQNNIDVYGLNDNIRRNSKKTESENRHAIHMVKNITRNKDRSKSPLRDVSNEPHRLKTAPQTANQSIEKSLLEYKSIESIVSVQDCNEIPKKEESESSIPVNSLNSVNQILDQEENRQRESAF